MLNNHIPIHIIAYPKSGSTWLQRLVSNTLNSPYGNGYHSEQNLVFPDSSYNGSYKILHSHYSRMDKLQH